MRALRPPLDAARRPNADARTNAPSAAHRAAAASTPAPADSGARASAPAPHHRRAAIAAAFVGSALLLAPLAAQAPAAPTVTTIQLPEKTAITDVMECDVDGDGLLDLVLATRDDAGERPSAQVHLRAKAGAPFAAAPSRPPLPLERDVVAFTFADVLPGPGRECVLLTPERVVA
ncbi:MAG: hypothetical protein ACK58X_04290, partial [Planctomycetota bacterium]